MSTRPTAPSDAPGPSPLQRPRIERWVDVPDYPGYRVKLWINYDRRLAEALNAPLPDPPAEDATADEQTAYDAQVQARGEAMEAAVKQIVLGHNGWPDEDGNVLPQPQDEAFWERLDQHLAAVLAVLILTEPGKPPASMLPRRRS
jgi:hypothetical protein